MTLANDYRGRQFGFQLGEWTAGMPSMVTKSVPSSQVGARAGILDGGARLFGQAIVRFE